VSVFSPAFYIGVRCHYCNKFRAPFDILHQPGGVQICTGCEQRHLEALEAIGTGNFLGECSECHKTAEQLHSPSGQMAMHFEDGKYRAMCVECDRAYVPKRRELYGETEYGHGLKLK
jgi:hypothetical protein